MRTGVQSPEFLKLYQVQMVIVNFTLEFPDIHVRETLGLSNLKGRLSIHLLLIETLKDIVKGGGMGGKNY